MKLFECQACGQPLYFENTACERCGRSIGFLPGQMTLSALEPRTDGAFTALGGSGAPVVYCANHAHLACNWLITPDDDNGLCLACDLNHTIPDLGVTENVERWQRLEEAKHRLVYSLLRLGLPVTPKGEGGSAVKGLAFDFLADTPATFRDDAETVITGHEHGLITLNIAEADDAVRAQMRDQMAEPYRTVLGHFRHEVGHYYWERLIANTHWLQPYRHLFGDERADYGHALEAHYASGPPADWAASHVSAYAAAHPWEDWAETWAHYLHMVDTLETAYAFRLSVRPRVGDDGGGMSGDASFDPYREDGLDRIVAAWLPLTYAVNSLNRSMGQPDLYPFVLSETTLEKLRFVHTVIRDTGG